jgi:hypothetical protein
VLTKIKHGSLVVCLFLFLFVVIGGGLHLKPGGAFLAAATGTPLVVHVFNRRWAGSALELPLHQKAHSKLGSRFGALPSECSTPSR